MKNERLIEQLADELTPVKVVRYLGLTSQVWLAMTIVLAVLFALFIGPFREGAFDQLKGSPSFMLESILGGLTIITLAVFAIYSAVPDRLPKSPVISILPWLLLTAWLGCYLYGIVEHGGNFDSHGKRPFCYLETMLLAMLPTVLGLMWVKKRAYPVNKTLTGVLFGMTSGLVAAMMMQFACMYDAYHALFFHVLPGLLMGGVGGFLAQKML